MTGFERLQASALLPMVELVEGSRMAIDEMIDILGRASIEDVLQLSAQRLALVASNRAERGRRSSGTGRSRPCDAVGTATRGEEAEAAQKGVGRGGEVEISAYEAINADGDLRGMLLDILMCIVSTRSYRWVIREMAETVGVGKSEASRKFIVQRGRPSGGSLHRSS